MIKYIKSPIFVWFVRLVKAQLLEFKNRKIKIKIGYLSSAKQTSFSMYNTLYENVLLDNVSLGSFTYVSNNTVIKNSKIGSFCSIGQNCSIGIGKHPTKDFISTHPIFFSSLKQSQITFCEQTIFKEFEEIIIENDVWIGANVIILDGVKISNGSVIAAGSIVTKDVPPYAIVGGVPAKVIKFRFSELEILKLLELKWWNLSIEQLRKISPKMINTNFLFND